MANNSSGYQIYEALLKAFGVGTEAVTALFNDDATIEFPYAPSIGAAGKQNMEAYCNHLEGGLKNMPNLKFSDIRVYPLQEEDTYWAEAHGETTIHSTGILYQQDYVMYFILKDGKFSFYREYSNPLPALKAFGGTQATLDMFNVNK